MINTLTDSAQGQIAMPLTNSNIFQFRSLNLAIVCIVIFSNG